MTEDMVLPEARTVTENLWTTRLLVVSPLLAVTVMVAVPVAFFTGVKVSVPTVAWFLYLTVAFFTK